MPQIFFLDYWIIYWKQPAYEELGGLGARGQRNTVQLKAHASGPTLQAFCWRSPDKSVAAAPLTLLCPERLLVSVLRSPALVGGHLCHPPPAPFDTLQSADLCLCLTLNGLVSWTSAHWWIHCLCVWPAGEKDLLSGGRRPSQSFAVLMGQAAAAAAASECPSHRVTEVLVSICSLETKALVSGGRAPEVLKHPGDVQNAHTFSGHLSLDCCILLRRHRDVFALKVHAADLGALMIDASWGNLSLSL